MELSLLLEGYRGKDMKCVKEIEVKSMTIRDELGENKCRWFLERVNSSLFLNYDDVERDEWASELVREIFESWLDTEVEESGSKVKVKKMVSVDPIAEECDDLGYVCGRCEQFLDNEDNGDRYCAYCGCEILWE